MVSLGPPVAGLEKLSFREQCEAMDFSRKYAFEARRPKCVIFRELCMGAANVTPGHTDSNS